MSSLRARTNYLNELINADAVVRPEDRTRSAANSSTRIIPNVVYWSGIV